MLETACLILAFGGVGTHLGEKWDNLSKRKEQIGSCLNFSRWVCTLRSLINGGDFDKRRGSIHCRQKDNRVGWIFYFLTILHNRKDTFIRNLRRFKQDFACGCLVKFVLRSCATLRNSAATITTGEFSSKQGRKVRSCYRFSILSNQADKKILL